MNIIALGLSLLVAFPVAAEMTAREIVEKQSEFHKLKNETSVMTLKLIDRKGYTENRTLRRLDKEHDNGLTSSLTLFDAPADIKNTALLTRENEGKANDQWLYFPSQRRLMRIAQARRNAYFMGTDFTYEDMDPEDIDDYTYRLMQEEVIDENPCYAIEATPANQEKQRSSGYGLRKLWIRKDIFYVVKIEFYNHQNVLLKTQINSELESLKGNVWRANRSFMENFDKQHQTEVLVTSRDIETEHPDDTFTDRHIRTGRYMK